MRSEPVTVTTHSVPSAPRLLELGGQRQYTFILYVSNLVHELHDPTLFVEYSDSIDMLKFR